MRKLILLTVLVGFLATISACKRKGMFENEDLPTGSTAPLKDIKVPVNFNFDTYRDLYVKVKVQDADTSKTRYRIRVYTDVPTTNSLIVTGITNTQFEYANTIQIPSGLEYLWIEKTDPAGNSQFVKVKASTFVSSSFSSGPGNVYFFKKSGSGLTCTSSCTSTYNNFSGSESFNTNNKSYCFTGNMSNGTIVINSNSTVKICGTGTINAIIINGSGKVYILESAQVTINSISTNNSSALVRNWSDSTILNGSLSLGGQLENYGKLYITGAVAANSSSQLENYGLMDIGGSLSANDDIENYNTMKIGGAMAINSGCDFENDCNLTVAGDLTVNNKLYNNAYIKVGGLFTLNSSTDCELNNGAMISTKDLTLNDDIEGKGSNTSIIKVTGNTTINGSGAVKGKINLCDNNGIETNFGNISSPAQASCSGSLSVTTCNPEGFGQVVVADADNDGVSDLLDEYPNDAARASNSYYPNATTFANIAYEDLWPFLGDFDYNDMVIAFNIQKVLNADNKVVDLKMKIKVRAVGGSLDNGFGFRLDDVQAADISTITGQVLSKNIISRSSNNTEAGQDRAVIICFDSPEPTLQRAPGSFFNTNTQNGKGTSDTIYINTTFSTPQDEAKLAINKLNPFIFVGQQRSKEVHLGNFAPTTLANLALFGTGNDASNPSAGYYYKTSNGIPWAIMITENFDYPKERAAINQTHLKFNEWATSGGTTMLNWFENHAEYRTDSLLYE